MGRKKSSLKRGKPKTAGKNRRAPAGTTPEPYVPNWGEVDPDLYEDLLEWVDTIEID